MSIWYLVGGVAAIALIVGGMSLYHSRLEDEGYWVPNSMKDVTMALVIIVIILLIVLPKLLEGRGG